LEQGFKSGYFSFFGLEFHVFNLALYLDRCKSKKKKPDEIRLFYKMRIGILDSPILLFSTPTFIQKALGNRTPIDAQARTNQGKWAPRNWLHWDIFRKGLPPYGNRVWR